MVRTKSRANGDGDVFPRKNRAGQITSYRGAYVGPDGKRRYVSGKNKEEARKALREARAGADAGLVFDAGTVTLAGYLERWLVDSANDTVRQGTYERYASIVRVHIKPSIGRVMLKALTPAHTRALYRQKLDAGLSPRTANYIHVTLHKALSQAMSDGPVPRNAAQVKAPRSAKPGSNRSPRTKPAGSSRSPTRRVTATPRSTCWRCTPGFAKARCWGSCGTTSTPPRPRYRSGAHLRRRGPGTSSSYRRAARAAP